MIKPGKLNLVTDVPGLKVGNARDALARTGVTVLLPDVPAVMAGDVRGGGPGTRETDALDPACLVEQFHGLVLSGGSVFGLDAAGGVVAWLSAQDIGLPIGPVAVPVVPSAILFDLNNGGDKSWNARPPYYALGQKACGNADLSFELGNAGAGYGAQAGGLKGGLGSASAVNDDGLIVGALVAVNSFGPLTMPGRMALWAAAYELGDEFASLAPNVRKQKPGRILPKLELPKQTTIGQNTTIGIVATNARLTKAQARRVAIMAQDGIARAIRPVHTPFDGDSVFAVATGTRDTTDNTPLEITRIGHMAADCMTRAIVRGVLAAESLGDSKGYRDCT